MNDYYTDSRPRWSDHFDNDREAGDEQMSLDNANITLTLTDEEYTLMVKAAEKGKGPVSERLLAKLIQAGIDKLRQIQDEEVLDTDLFFAPERTGRVF